MEYDYNSGIYVTIHFVKIKHCINTFKSYVTNVTHKVVGTVLGLGEGKKTFSLYHTLTYKKDILLLVHLHNKSVIYKIHWAMSLFKPYCYILNYMWLFLNSYSWGVGKLLGEGDCLSPCPPPPLFLRPWLNSTCCNFYK